MLDERSPQLLRPLRLLKKRSEYDSDGEGYNEIGPSARSLLLALLPAEFVATRAVPAILDTLDPSAVPDRDRWTSRGFDEIESVWELELLTYALEALLGTEWNPWIIRGVRRYSRGGEQEKPPAGLDDEGTLFRSVTAIATRLAGLLLSWPRERRKVLKLLEVVSVARPAVGNVECTGGLVVEVVLTYAQRGFYERDVAEGRGEAYGFYREVHTLTLESLPSLSARLTFHSFPHRVSARPGRRDHHAGPQGAHAAGDRVRRRGPA